MQALQQSGGAISGVVTFVPGVNADAASFGTLGQITYSNHQFMADSGSASFWFKKNPDAQGGGMLEIGSLGSMPPP